MKPLIYILLTLTLASCQTDKPKEVSEIKTSAQEKTLDIEQDSAVAPDTLTKPISVMVVPCANGYDYNMKMGDLNPSLEKFLNLDKRIELKPFPLKKMNGSGYFGVFDKKDCAKILEKVEVDFLVMTRMKGMILLSTDSSTGTWGYDTKILKIDNMEQFNGISASNLKSFESIDYDIKSKMDQLVTQIIESKDRK